MPYTGKPSRGCYTCRKRKVKCDEVKPECARCLKAGRVCLGYRDEFRNNFVEERARSSVPPSASPASFRYRLPDLVRQGSGSREISSRPESEVGEIPRSLPLDLESVAICRLFHDVVLRPNGGPSPGYFTFLPDLWKGSFQGALASTTILAFAFANLAGKTNTTYLPEVAREKYISSLVMVKASLNDQALSKANDTLAAVWLLSFCELFSCINGRFTWEAHMAGARGLLTSRGEDLFKTELGARLYTQVFMTGLITSLATSTMPMPLPSEDRLISRPMAFHPGFSLIHILHDTCILRASTKNIFADVPALLLKAVALEEEFDHWGKKSRLLDVDLWSYRVVDSGCVIPRQTHVYRDLWVASLWSMYRTGRIELHATMLKLCTEKGQRERSHAIIAAMAKETIEAVPFFMGDVIEVDAPTLGGIFLLWPLGAAASEASIPVEMRIWVKSKLWEIGKRMGIRQATEMAHLTLEFPRFETLQIA